jgi:Cu2+-containing amine oxidase
VYNYDYIFDYHLHLNGVVEAKVHTTGYIQAVPYLLDHVDSISKYGMPVRNYTHSAVHDHMVHYKVP